MPKLSQNARAEFAGGFLRGDLECVRSLFLLLQFPRNHFTKSLHLNGYLFRI